jgi:hypothetical protein
MVSAYRPAPCRRNGFTRPHLRHSNRPLGFHGAFRRTETGTGRNAARWRHNFTKVDDEDAPDTGVPQLHIIKSNYGPQDEKVKVVWRNGMFVPLTRGSPMERAAAEAPIDQAFLACLDAATAQGRSVGPKASKSWAPSLFEKFPEANGFKCKALESATERLFSAIASGATTAGRPRSAESGSRDANDRPPASTSVSATGTTTSQIGHRKSQSSFGAVVSRGGAMASHILTPHFGQSGRGMDLSELREDGADMSRPLPRHIERCVVPAK